MTRRFLRSKEATDKTYNIDGVEVRCRVELEESRDYQNHANYITGDDLHKDIKKVISDLKDYVKPACISIELINNVFEVDIAFDTGKVYHKNLTDLLHMHPGNLIDTTLPYWAFKECSDGFLLAHKGGWSRVGERGLEKFFTEFSTEKCMTFELRMLIDFLRECLDNGIKIELSDKEFNDVDIQVCSDYGDHFIYMRLNVNDVFSNTYKIGLKYFMQESIYSIKKNIMKDIVTMVGGVFVPIDEKHRLHFDIDGRLEVALDNESARALIPLYSFGDDLNINKIIRIIQAVKNNPKRFHNVLKLMEIGEASVEKVDNSPEFVIIINEHKFSPTSLPLVDDYYFDAIENYDKRTEAIHKIVHNFNSKNMISDLELKVNRGFPTTIENIHLGCQWYVYDMEQAVITHKAFNNFLMHMTTNMTDLMTLSKEYEVELSYCVNEAPFLRLKAKHSKFDINLEFHPCSTKSILEYVKSRIKSINDSKSSIERICRNCRFFSPYVIPGSVTTENYTSGCTSHSCKYRENTVDDNSTCELFSASDKSIERHIRNMIVDRMNYRGDK